MTALETASPNATSVTAPPRPIRVCYLIDELRRAGTELRLQRLIRALPRDLIQPHLCLLRNLGDAADPGGPPDCPTLELNLRSFRSWNTLSAARSLRSFLRRQEIDIVELYFRDAMLLGAPVARAAGVRHVVRTSFNLGYWMTRTDRLISFFTRPLIDHTITNCEAGRAAAMKNFGTRVERTTVLANGIELEAFLELAPPPPVPRALHVGMVANLRPVKGVFDFVRAARLVLDEMPGVRFSVAGGGELHREVQAEIDRLNLTEQFRLIGRTDDIPGYLATLQVAVLSSHSEALSNSLIEYLAAARPVVATDVGGAREILANGQFGTLTPPQSPEALARSLSQILEHYPAAVAAAQAGRTFVAEHYTIPQMTNQFTRFYCSLMGKDPPTTPLEM